MELRFVKLSNRWFVDIPWDGMIEDLEMVNGSDLFLDSISGYMGAVSIGISTEEMPDSVKISKVREDEFGAFYRINIYEYKGEIWLCNVTKHLFNEFPKNFWIKL